MTTLCLDRGLQARGGRYFGHFSLFCACLSEVHGVPVQESRASPASKLIPQFIEVIERVFGG